MEKYYINIHYYYDVEFLAFFEVEFDGFFYFFQSQKLFNRNGLIATKHDVSQEEREFLTNIYKFMDKRNSPIDRLPSLGFKQSKSLWGVCVCT